MSPLGVAHWKLNLVLKISCPPPWPEANDLFWASGREGGENGQIRTYEGVHVLDIQFNLLIDCSANNCFFVSGQGSGQMRLCTQEWEIAAKGVPIYEPPLGSTLKFLNWIQNAPKVSNCSQWWVNEWAPLGYSLVHLVEAKLEKLISRTWLGLLKRYDCCSRTVWGHRILDFNGSLHH